MKHPELFSIWSSFDIDLSPEDMVLAITKNSKSKKMRSVIDDIAKVASTLFRLFRAILGRLVFSD